jgi:hypothetical protein
LQVLSPVAHPIPPLEVYMRTRLACGLIVAAVSALAAPLYADEVDVQEAPISVVGCIQREAEYRRQQNLGKGGFLGFGGGLGNEYVLVNASRGADGVFGDCTAATGGEAYELTGPGEGALEAFVGQRVAVAGIRKEAEVDTETGRPTGGRERGDLRLFEVDVTSFRPLATPVQSVAVARQQPQPQFQQEPQPQVRDEPQGVEPDAAAPPRRVRQDAGGDQLPRTASPLAMTGLLGVLSLAAVAGLRRRRRGLY